jgi:putative AdoMet-dependent methyltransferase
VDFSPGMLARAGSRIPNGIFRKVDVSKDHFGEFSDWRFDRIVSTYFLHHLNFHQQTTLLRRALMDNLSADGRIIVADVGFETESDYQAGHNEFQADWDEDEFYLCGEAIVSRLETESISAVYKQISCCAGILICERME